MDSLVKTSSLPQTVQSLHGQIQDTRTQLQLLAPSNPLVQRVLTYWGSVQNEYDALATLVGKEGEAREHFRQLQQVYRATGQDFFGSYEDYQKALQEEKSLSPHIRKCERRQAFYRFLTETAPLGVVVYSLGFALGAAYFNLTGSGFLLIWGGSAVSVALGLFAKYCENEETLTDLRSQYDALAYVAVRKKSLAITDTLKRCFYLYPKALEGDLSAILGQGNLSPDERRYFTYVASAALHTSIQTDLPLLRFAQLTPAELLAQYDAADEKGKEVILSQLLHEGVQHATLGQALLQHDPDRLRAFERTLLQQRSSP